MSLVFKVRKGETELVKPAKPTLNEVKSLSDWDNRVVLQYRVSCIMFYKGLGAISTVLDPTERIKRALAEALMYYYPMAGRLKDHGSDKRLVVDCNGEGVEFVSADADITLDQLAPLHPPHPCMSDLLHNPNSRATLDCPIFVMQVTRLVCGGFIVAFCFNHVMCDTAGAVQFVTAISELSRGAQSPSILPIWWRELLNAHCNDPNPPAPPHMPRIIKSRRPIPETNMTYRSFFFGDRELKAIRDHMQPPQSPTDHFTSFELISGCLFHCRVISLEHSLEQQVCACFTINARSKFVQTLIPPGYYGNASFTVNIICHMHTFHDLRYVVEQVKKEKDNFTEESARLSIEQQVISHRFDVKKIVPLNYGISDVSRAGLSNLEFGLGDLLYAGAVDDVSNDSFNFMVASTNSEGEEGRLITLGMPIDAMEKFDYTLRNMLGFI